MAAMDRTGVARALERISAYLALKGENPFRVRAFTVAARGVLGHPGDLAAALDDGSLAQARGIGPAILAVIEELINTGRSEFLEQLRREIPSGLVEMLGISGLGVTRIRRLHEMLGVETLGDLEAAARDGRIAALPRFGSRTAENILKGIAFLRRAGQSRLLHHATQEAESLRSAFSQLPHVLSAHVAGEVRRRCETATDLVLVLVADISAEELFHELGTLGGVREIAGEDERQARLYLAGGTSVQVIATPPQNLGAVLVQATGSEKHLRELARIASSRGYTLAGTALWRGSQFIPTPSEPILYQTLGLPWMPPELRETGTEIGQPVPRLVELADLKGLIHCHTVYSDGTNTVRELATACRAAGYQYLGVTDHSRAAAYARGMASRDLVRQWAEIDALNGEGLGIRILKGIECDIMNDGTLDYDDRTLAEFDFVIASIHLRGNLTEQEQTERLCRAMESPWVTIIGHPTGRLLLAREPYPIDMDKVLERAAGLGVAIEINADPRRLDLDWRLLDQARNLGVMISISADAHHIGGIGNVQFGLDMARKGGLRPEDILNSRDVDGFLEFARARPRHGG